ncbi:MAG: single-stranded-DNA-specific exonuclease RecJ [Acidobacteria bacterium]|nr:single-stranded-DNA-specific exonuclease RecJ [Acidobacteriota bacterium]MXZ38394.1 single-stranded-DNA-specific exonuclease RecJ [Holophagales bacterium]
MTRRPAVEEERTDAAEWIGKPTPENAEALAEAGYGLLAAPLARRGVGTPSEADAFLAPHRRDLHDPFLLYGMEEAVERLRRVCRDRGTVAVVGDYDVDGVTACALLTAVLRAVGASVVPILPNRLTEGYGFQTLQVEKADRAGASLIVTVDCGTTSSRAVLAAIDRGIDVIVTDHHVVGSDFPSQAIQINPLQDDCGYPFRHLCGAGLAFKLAQGVLRRSGREEPLAALLRIACLGTIADVVPLVGENRVIAALGLRALSEARSPGLRALMRVARVGGSVSSTEVAFRLGPRINAAGRLADAGLALRLLLTRDSEEADRLAGELDTLNRNRQVEERRVVKQAAELFATRDPLPGILVAWSPEWHRGVVGIAAGRLAREFHRPVILLGVEGDTGTGSGRSIPHLDLHSFVAGFQHRTTRFGGHPQAIGLSVAVSELPDLKSAMEERAEWPPAVLMRRREYELELSAEQIDTELYAELARLEPHGEGNRRPLIRLGPLERVGPLREFGQDHVKLRVRAARGEGSQGGRPVWMLGWGWKERTASLDGRFEVLGALEWDSYQGGPVVRIEDARPFGSDQLPERRMSA